MVAFKDITLQVVVWAIRNMKNGKNAGIDMVSAKRSNMVVPLSVTLFESFIISVPAECLNTDGVQSSCPGTKGRVHV